MPVGRLAENQRRYVAVNSNPRLAVSDSHLLRRWRYGERNRPQGDPIDTRSDRWWLQCGRILIARCLRSFPRD